MLPNDAPAPTASCYLCTLRSGDLAPPSPTLPPNTFVSFEEEKSRRSPSVLCVCVRGAVPHRFALRLQVGLEQADLSLPRPGTRGAPRAPKRGIGRLNFHAAGRTHACTAAGCALCLVSHSNWSLLASPASLRQQPPDENLSPSARHSMACLALL